MMNFSVSFSHIFTPSGGNKDVIRVRHCTVHSTDSFKQSGNKQAAVFLSESLNHSKNDSFSNAAPVCGSESRIYWNYFHWRSKNRQKQSILQGYVLNVIRFKKKQQQQL